MWPFRRKPEPTPAPPAPTLPNLWGLEPGFTARPAWPRIVMSDVWTHDLEPWFKALLADTLGRLMVEKDADNFRALQVRAMLLQGLIDQPKIEIGKLQALADNNYQAGGDPLPARNGR